MTCDETLSLLDAWLDGELYDARSHGVERHLADCDDCRSAAAAWREHDAALRSVVADHAAAAERVTDRVLAVVGTSSPYETRSTRSTSSSSAGQRPVPSGDSCELPVRTTVGEARPQRAWTTYAATFLAAAAGFLVAVLLFQPWRNDVRIVEVPGTPIPRVAPDVPIGVPIVPAVARFTTATGPVEYRPPAGGDWQAVPDLATFLCPSDTALRTGPNVKAELRTSDGSVLRMDDSTALVLRGPDEVEMQSGQLWCRAPHDQPFKVVASPASPLDPPRPPETPAGIPAGPWSMVCPPATSCQASTTAGRVTITSSEGELEVLTKAGRRTVARGETVEIEGDAVVAATTFETDPLLSTRWIHPLLVRRGHGDDELGERVDAMLARVGATKLSSLYEAEIRSLGEYGVLPLLRYVQSEGSTADFRQQARRETAMRIVADLAPTWAVGDLVGLLADADPRTRVLAATALERLTGERPHLAPAEWATADAESRTTAHEAWLAWWNENRGRYPSVDED